MVDTAPWLLLSRWVLRLLAAVAALAVPSGPPATIAVAPGPVVAVSQDSASVAWLETTASGCRLRVRPLAGGTARALPYAAGCLPDQELALAGGRAAWGGYSEVRCTDTHATVYAAGESSGRVVQEIPGDCLGYRTAFRGLTTDGNSFFYSLLETSPPGSASVRCGDGGPCRWRLAGGRIVRIAGSRPVTVRGLPPAALLAGANGRLALVEPARSASSDGQTFDWPRAARNGTVEIRDTGTTRIVTSFRPRGTVRAVALSATRAAVLVEAPGSVRIEWYDSDSGARLGAVPVPRSTARRLSTDGRFVAFAAGKTVRVLDLETAVQRIVRRTAEEAPVGLSVLAGRLVWGENGGRGGRMLSATA